MGLETRAHMERAEKAAPDCRQIDLTGRAARLGGTEVIAMQRLNRRLGSLPRAVVVSSPT